MAEKVWTAIAVVAVVGFAVIGVWGWLGADDPHLLRAWWLAR